MDNLMKPALRSALFFVVLCLLVWAIVPSLRMIAAGFILGTLASALNAFLLLRRINLVGQQASAGVNRRMNLGLASRLATALLAVMIAYRYPHIFNLPATLISCFYVQLSLFIIMVVRNKRDSS